MGSIQVVSIHGVPRSGTSWLGQIFNSHPKVAYRQQPLFAYRFKDRINVHSSREEVCRFLEELLKVTDDDFILDKRDAFHGLLPAFEKDACPSHMVMKMVRYHHLLKKLMAESLCRDQPVVVSSDGILTRLGPEPGVQDRKAMNRWKKFWNSYPLNVEETECLRQVGKTVRGQPISDSQVQRIVSDVVRHLEVSDDDVVLDLCCGNGLITKEIARLSRRVVGVDYSRPLIRIARKYHQPDNVRYVQCDVLDLAAAALDTTDRFTKAYMYEALQHFRKEDLAPMLRIATEMTERDATMLIGSVPDKGLVWRFYNTPRRKADYLMRRLQGREPIGTWWERRYIRETCERIGLRCEFFDQDPMLHTAHYRFDFRINRCLS